MTTAVVVGARGNIGSSLVSRLVESGIEVDSRWTANDRPDVRDRTAFNSFPSRVDLAVYVAGVNVVKPVNQMSDEDWDSVIDVNLSAAFRFARGVEAHLRRSTNPHLVFISSIMTTHPYPNRTAYAASKGGVEALTRALGVEWGSFCTTYALRLGHVTGLMKTTVANPELLRAVAAATPSAALVKPDEVSDFVLSAFRNRARVLNASVIDMDFGYTANRWPLRHDA